MSLSALRYSFSALASLIFLVPTFPIAVSLQPEDWFALTLALSPGRGNAQSPPWEESPAVGRIAELRKFLPLPGGPFLRSSPVEHGPLVRAAAGTLQAVGPSGTAEGGEGRGEGERLIPLNSYGAVSDYFPPPDGAGGWRAAKDAAQARELAAMDLPKLEQAWEFTQRCTQNGGLLVVRRGYLVFENYFGRASRNANPDMASTGKAYTSIACGIMLREFRDKIPEGLDTKVFTEKFLPEAFPLDDARRADITLGQLLCMTGGYNGEGQSPTAVIMGKAFPLKAVPGQNIHDLDTSSLRCAMWTNAGAGY